MAEPIPLLWYRGTIMRQILVEHARGRNADKRGEGACRLSLDGAVEFAQQTDFDVLELDRALSELAELDEQQSRIVECVFCRITVEDTSEVLGISPATVKRDWVTARIWLHRAMTGGASA